MTAAQCEVDECDAARRNARARHEIKLAWGSGSIDFRRLLAILTDPDELHQHEPEKEGPESAMAERGRQGGDAPDRPLGHGDGGS